MEGLCLARDIQSCDLAVCYPNKFQRQGRSLQIDIRRGGGQNKNQVNISRQSWRVGTTVLLQKLVVQ